jgi:hypothetical protein
MLKKLKEQEGYYDKNKNKGVMFFSASSVGDTKQLVAFGIREILVSYFYIRKGLTYYDEVLPFLKSEGGLFMTDSGAFSFMATGFVEEMRKEEYWIPYLEEYVAWVRAHSEYIYVVANLDLDKIVGREIVRKWNKKYFEPLEKIVDVVYVAHEDESIDPHGIEHFEEYCKKYKYVGINQSQKKFAHRFFLLAKKYKVRVHGFAWTEIRILRRYPFFSVDSTSWLSGVRYGTTFNYDGKNFKSWDTKQKFRRKGQRIKYEEAGVDFSKVTKKDHRDDVNRMNLLAWLGFRKEYIKIANLLLTNKEAGKYERKR